MGRALVTGALGQDGSYLVDLLITQGWEVHGTAHGAGYENHGLPSGVNIHPCDLTVPGVPSTLVARVEPDVVFNLAGISSVAQSWERPAETGRANATSVAEFLEAIWSLRERDVHVKFIQASSAEIFGQPTESPQKESTQIRPVSPYGAAKAYAHQLVALYRARGLFASNAILYNHESPRRPETFVTRKISSTVAKIALGYETTLRLGNMDIARDWGWAPDYMDAMYRMSQTAEAGDFIISTGQSHTIREFVSLAFKAAGIDDWELHTEIDERFIRPTDATESRGDNSKAYRLLNWQPTQSFREIVGTMVEHDLHNVGSAQRRAGR